MSKITYVNLPSTFVEDNMWIYPLGILGMVQFTRSIGHDARLLDLAPISSVCNTQEEIEESIMLELATCDADFFGISAVTPQYELFRKIPKMTDRPCIAGGVHPTLFPMETLRLGYHAVVVGEGELSIHNAMVGNRGVYACEGETCLDSLPLVDRTMVEGYHGPAPVMAGRGCPFRCSFCARINGLDKARLRSPARVIDELLEIENNEVIFYDDTFTMNRKWLEILTDMICRFGIKKRFRCSTRSDRMTDDVAKMLVNAGFDEVCLGVESGSQEILDTLNKKTKVETNTEAVNVCRRNGLRVKAFIMVGNPGESHETMSDTLSWLEANKPEKIGLYILNPLPGSDIYDHPEKYDISFNRMDYQRMFYGGRRGEITSRVSTSRLSADEITGYYHMIRERFPAACGV